MEKEIKEGIKEKMKEKLEEEMTWSDRTLKYYNEHADAFSQDTFHVKFTQTQEAFLSLLKPHSRILDFGCGSGRDTRYFLKKGYCVEAIDGSEKMCEIAKEHTGIQVRQMMFQDLSEIDKYDGIWACSSILHLPRKELLVVIPKMFRALKRNGIIYTSFKYGDFEGNRNGRYFTDFTEESFIEFLEQLKCLKEEKEQFKRTNQTDSNSNESESIREIEREIPEKPKNFEISTEKIWITGDARPGRGDEKWLNLILRKM